MVGTKKVNQIGLYSEAICISATYYVQQRNTSIVCRNLLIKSPDRISFSSKEKSFN